MGGGGGGQHKFGKDAIPPRHSLVEAGLLITSLSCCAVHHVALGVLAAQNLLGMTYCCSASDSAIMDVLALAGADP